MKSVNPKRSAPAPPPAKAAPRPAPVPQRRPFWQFALPFAAALLMLFQIYGPALHGPFLLDDSYLPYNIPAYIDAPFKTWIAGLRPLLMASFWANFQISGGQDTFSYHVVNVLLHFLNGVLVFLAVRKILQWSRQTDAFSTQLLAGFGAALFLFHPLQTEAVSYVASRSETLSVFFVLASFVVFLYRPSPAIGFGSAAAVLVLAALGLLTKEHAAAVIGVFLLTDFFWNPGFNLSGIRRNWKLYVPSLLGAVAAAIVVLRVLSTSKSAGFGLKDFTWYQYFFSQCRAFWVYLRFFVLPYGQNIDHDFTVSRSIVDHGAIFGLLALVVAIAAAWFYRKRYPIISYGFFVALVLFAPTSSFIPIRDLLVERRLYLPFIGLVLMLVGAFVYWVPRRQTVVIAFSGILIVMAFLTYQRNQLWGDSVAIWKDSVEKSPRKLRPNFQLAYALQYGGGKCQEAADQYARTAPLGPPDYGLLLDWGLALDCAGNTDAALIKLKEAAQLEPSAHSYSQIAREYAKTNRFPEALDYLNQAEHYDPNFEMIYAYRGNIYSVQGQNDRAVEEYRHALMIDPRNPDALQGMQRLHR